MVITFHILRGGLELVDLLKFIFSSGLTQTKGDDQRISPQIEEGRRKREEGSNRKHGRSPGMVLRRKSHFKIRW